MKCAGMSPPSPVVKTESSSGLPSRQMPLWMASSTLRQMAKAASPGKHRAGGDSRSQLKNKSGPMRASIQLQRPTQTTDVLGLAGGGGEGHADGEISCANLVREPSSLKARCKRGRVSIGSTSKGERAVVPDFEPVGVGS